MRVCPFRINRSEWSKLLLAAFSQRVCVVPLYDTLGANACTFIIQHAELTTVACERSKLDNLIKSKASLPNFANIVLFESPTREEIAKAAAYDSAQKDKLFPLPELSTREIMHRACSRAG